MNIVVEDKLTESLRTCKKVNLYLFHIFCPMFLSGIDKKTGQCLTKNTCHHLNMDCSCNQEVLKRRKMAKYSSTKIEQKNELSSF